MRVALYVYICIWCIYISGVCGKAEEGFLFHQHNDVVRKHTNNLYTYIFVMWPICKSYIGIVKKRRSKTAALDSQHCSISDIWCDNIGAKRGWIWKVHLLCCVEHNENMRNLLLGSAMLLLLFAAARLWWCFIVINMRPCAVPTYIYIYIAFGVEYLDFMQPYNKWV